MRLIEEWKDIQGYEGVYQVSNFGRVKSLERYRINNGGTKTLVKERILKPSTNNKGYSRVELSNKTARKPYLVHRLVAEAFIENPNNLPEVNHKDENKSNNRADNLEWITQKENLNYGTRNHRVSLTKGSPAVALDDENNIIMEFHSISEASRQTGIPQQNISRCIKGKVPHAGGYVWKLKSEIVRNGVE